MVAELLALAVAGIALASPAAAEDSVNPPSGEAPRISIIPLEDTDEVRAVREGRASHSYAETSVRSIEAAEPESNRFLAAIDLGKLDPNIVGGSEEGARSATAEAADSLDVRTIYDAGDQRATSFETRYDVINATLQCHWAYADDTARQLSELDAKAREAELERSAGDQRAGVEPQPENDELRAAGPEDTDPEFDFTLKERQFRIAGRPCLLTVTCQDANDPRCSDKFIDEVVKSTVVVRTGE